MAFFRYHFTRDTEFLSLHQDIAALIQLLDSGEFSRGRLPRQSCVNDPSAGSPTETLLRLILPLNDKVYETSRFRAIAGQMQSESFTGSLNR